MARQSTRDAIRRGWRWIEQHPPPGPFRPGFFRSPLRGRWLTSVLGLVLVIGVPIVFLTGLFSYAAYNPDLPGNDRTPEAGLLADYLFRWPTRPTWLYRLNQGTHVTLGLVLIPVVLAKLWSVLPKLFQWPPVRSPAQAIERLSVAGLVGAGILTFATGVMDIQYWYEFPNGFYKVHFYGSWVFVGCFVAHVAVKLTTMRRGLRDRKLLGGARTDAKARANPPDDTGLASPNPAPPTMSRRALLGTVGAGAALVGVMGAGQNLGGPFRSLALLAPRGNPAGDGPNDFPVNKTAAFRGITAEATGDGWRLELRGRSPIRLTREELLALPQHTADLPIACVEGWSTGVQRWTGVRLRDLAELAGVPRAGLLVAESLQERGGFRRGAFARNQIHDPDALLALRVNGADLSLDHGFPARVVIPAAPGVRNTKWVSTLRFEDR